MSKYYLALKGVNDELQSCFVNINPVLCVQYKVGRKARGVHPELPLWIVGQDDLRSDGSGFYTGGGHTKAILVKVLNKNLVKKVKFKFGITDSISDVLAFGDEINNRWAATELTVLEIVPDSTNYPNYIEKKCKQYKLPFLPRID